MLMSEQSTQTAIMHQRESHMFTTPPAVGSPEHDVLSLNERTLELLRSSMEVLTQYMGASSQMTHNESRTYFSTTYGRLFFATTARSALFSHRRRNGGQWQNSRARTRLT